MSAQILDSARLLPFDRFATNPDAGLIRTASVGGCSAGTDRITIAYDRISVASTRSEAPITIAVAAPPG